VYTVYRDGTKITAVTGTSATITGLAASTSYSFQVTATNSAGESGKSTAVTGTTTATGGGGGGTLPKHAVTGYWQNFNNGATVQKLSAVSSQYDTSAVAFATRPRPRARSRSRSTRPARGYTVDQFKADIAAKHAPARRSSSRSAARTARSR